MHNLPAPDDLNWLAFRYAAGEMSAPECAAFEQRLVDDQLAREAVAEAVELAEVTLATYQTASRAQRPASVAPPSAGHLWATISCLAAGTAAACLLLAIVLAPDRDGRQSASSKRPAEQTRTLPVSEELAVAWTQSFDHLPAAWEQGLSTDWDEAMSDPLERTDWDQEIPEAVQAPTWMFAAVSGMAMHDSDAEEEEVSHELDEQGI